MTILIICNAFTPEAAKALGVRGSTRMGWVEGLLTGIEKTSMDSLNLYICTPYYKVSETIRANKENITYLAIPKPEENIKGFLEIMTDQFKILLKEVNPDIVHIFGTEYFHTLAMVNASMSIPTIISIQGLVSIYAKHYLTSLPNSLFRFDAFRKLTNITKRNSISYGKEQFDKCGDYEIKALEKARYVEGRTTWDYACVKQVNRNIKYYFLDRTLRDTFYNKSWEISNCVKHSIFITQASYPIKGLHILLEAIPIILDKFPTAHVYIAGGIQKFGKGIKQKIKNAVFQYNGYICKLVNKFKLNDKITYLGDLSEQQMYEQFLKSHVYVLPSLIENESNSLCEAMILGVPCVASYVGGLPDSLEHNKEGFLFQCDAPYMLAHYVCEIFGCDELALRFSFEAKKRASIRHNQENNYNELISIYKDIIMEL